MKHVAHDMHTGGNSKHDNVRWILNVCKIYLEWECALSEINSLYFFIAIFM